MSCGLGTWCFLLLATADILYLPSGVKELHHSVTEMTPCPHPLGKAALLFADPSPSLLRTHPTFQHSPCG
jgi:hypothetical protein